MDITLLKGSSDPVLSFAKDELESYLVRMGTPDLTIQLGTAELTGYGLPSPKDPQLDDQYYIDVQGDGGVILGDNPRAVLLGVYRYLTLIGCRFLRPGKQFEIVPVKTLASDYVAKESHASSLRHRGACIEGADSIENILDYIDWSPKVGFNSFFLQFKYPHTFMKQYYDHEENPLLPKVGWTMEDSMRSMASFDKAMAKRGILQHRVGHGWTSEALGCKATGWDTEEMEFDEKTRNRIALVNGKRELFHGIPTNTNLCLTNPDAVEAYTEAVVKYLKENPHTDYLHLWLADGWNNSCECENCVRPIRGITPRPADHYISLLNHIDEVLTKEKIPARLVLLMYVDLLWPPVVNTLKNPDRFVLMFAPITRTFEKGFEEHGPLNDPPAFQLNQLKFPRDLESNLSLLREWQKAGAGDAFDYDYYMGRAHYGDPTYVQLSKLIARDLKFQPQLQLNGISSCQELRAHLPNALACTMMAKIADNTSLNEDELMLDYYTDCYGEDGPKVLKVMKALSDCFFQDYVLNTRPRIDAAYAEKLTKVPALLEELKALCKDHVLVQYEVQSHMWQELDFFIQYTDLYTKIIYALVTDHQAEAVQLFDEAFAPLCQRHEVVDQSSLDVFRISKVFGNCVKKDFTHLGLATSTN